MKNCKLFVVAANCCRIQGKLDFFGMSLLLLSAWKVLTESVESDTELVGNSYQECSLPRTDSLLIVSEVYGKLL